ncbi:MAG: hypothetical protein K2F90_00280 [Clostridiales bacterium]|nr:hypothetical protein [Clostridiales bacterium]
MNNLFSIAMPFISADGLGMLSDATNWLLDNIWTFCLSIAGTVCAIWGIVLGILYLKSGADEQKRRLSKAAIVSYVIGIIVIFAVATGTPLVIDMLVDWRQEYSYAVSFLTM